MKYKLQIYSMLLFLLFVPVSMGAQTLMSNGNVSLRPDVMRNHQAGFSLKDVHNSFPGIATKERKDIETPLKPNSIEDKSLSTHKTKEGFESFSPTAVSAPGTINASSLADNAEVKLSGKTNIYMDVSKSLKSISGDYSLTISGGNTLTLNNPGGYAINVSDITVSCPLNITASEVAIGAKNGITINNKVNAKSTNTCIGTIEGTITISADVMATTSKSAALLSRRGDIVINSGTINATGGTSGAWKYGIAAGKSITAKAGTTIIATAGTAIYAEDGNVSLAGTVTATAKHSEGYGIYASGSITVAKTTIPMSDVAIGAVDGNITINGEVNAKSTNTCIGTVEGTLTINADVTATTSKSAALLSRRGDISINSGTVNATGGTSGSWQYGIAAGRNVTIKGGKIYASCGSKALYSEGSAISISSPLSIVAPTNGKISGTTIVDANNKEASYVEIGTPLLTGAVEIVQPNATVGSTLTYKLSGMVYDLQQAGAAVSVVWERSKGVRDWTVVSAGPYNVSEQYVGQYVRARASVAGYEGYLYSGNRLIVKAPCATPVVSPILEVSNNQVRVTNPQANQEYIIMTQKKAWSELTDNYWANSKTWTSGIFYLGGTTNTVNYVYTRVKEDAGHFAGKTIGNNSIYLGTTTAVQAVSMEVKRVYQSSTRFFYLDVDQDDLGAYYLQCGEVYRIRALPTPEDATFNGILGSKWLVAGYSRASQYGRYYSDRACTTLIDANTSYKTVYFKPQDGTMVNYKELRVEYTKGYNDVATDAVLVNIATSVGYYRVDNLYASEVTIGKGEKMEGLELATRPEKATIRTFSATKNSGEGTAPIITFDTESQTCTVDATNATTGTYYYNVSVNSTASTTMKVTVTAPEVESIKLLPEEITLDRGTNLQMALQLFPTNAEAKSIIWKVQNNSFATVTSDGFVTVKDDAKRGKGTVIIATVDGKYQAFCTLTVPKLVPDLSFGEYTDEINVGASFTPPVLNNPDELNVTYSSDDESIATVNTTTGAVTIVGNGTVIITASFAGDDNYEPYQTSYSITINRLASGLAYAVTSASGTVGKAFTPPTLTNPHNLPVTYSSDNPFVATVDEATGEVTLIGAGTAVITAYTDGNGTYESDEARYTLKVEAPSGIIDIHADDPNQDDGNWYTMSGTKLLQKPTKRGVYIHRGKKVVVR